MASTAVEVTASSEHKEVLAGGDRHSVGIGRPSAAWRRMERKREVVRALMGGTASIRELVGNGGPGSILERFAGEEDSEFSRRVRRTVLDNFFLSAVEDLAGQVFARPLSLSEDLPAEISDRDAGWWQDVDLTERSGDAFFLEVCTWAVAEGLSYVLVDVATDVDQGLPASAARPHLAFYPGHQVLRVVLQGSRIVHAVIEEVADSEDGLEEVTLIREYWVEDAPGLSTVRWRLHTWDAARSEWMPGVEGQLDSRMQEIPLVPFYAGRVGPHEALPPLQQLIDLQLCHLNKLSDHDQKMIVVNNPALLAAGFNSDELENELASVSWGPYRIISSASASARVDVIEHAGEATGASFQDLERIERRMAAAAKDPMVRRATGSELATVRLLDEARSSTRVQAWAVGWQRSMTACLRLMMTWYGLDPVGSVSVREEVLRGLGAQASSESLVREVVSRMTDESLFEMARRAGLLWDDFDPKTEALRRKVQPPEMRVGPALFGDPDDEELEDDEDETAPEGKA